MKLVIALIALLASSWCEIALADCAASSRDTSLGTVSSFTLTSTAQTVETGTGFNCSGSLLSILSTNTVTATLISSASGSSNTPRMYSSANGSYVPYTICDESDCSSIISVGSSKTWSSTTLLGLLGLFNASDGSLPLFIKTTTGVNVPAGTYTDTLTLSWNYRICFVGILGICVYTTGTATSFINITLVVANDCAIVSAPKVDFGSASLPAGFSSITSALGIRCTLNASYTVNLTSSNASIGNWRQMSASTSAGTSLLQYQLYRPDGMAWTASNDLSENGTGVTQNISFTSRVNPGQPNQPAGNYSDTVTVAVTY